MHVLVDASRVAGVEGEVDAELHAVDVVVPEITDGGFWRAVVLRGTGDDAFHRGVAGVEAEVDAVPHAVDVVVPEITDEGFWRAVVLGGTGADAFDRGIPAGTSGGNAPALSPSRKG